MRTISIKDLVDFKRRSEKSKKTFISILSKGEVKSDPGSEMDYWSTGLSAICKSFKWNTQKPLLCISV